jgi:hypothetical protein
MQARESMLPLTNFVQKYIGNNAEAEVLVKTFLTGHVPSAQYFPLATKYVAKEYLDRKSEASCAGALGTFLQCALSRAFPDGFPTWQFDKNEKRQMLAVLLKLYGNIPTDKASNMQILLFSRAAFYQFSHMGSCSYRSSYAALQLFKILQGTSLNVALQSAPSVDQFTVLLGNKKEGYYVYDPLTNPLMVFDREFYIKNILSTFPKAAYTATAMNLTITKELSETYDSHFSVIKDEFEKLLISTEQNARVLLQNPSFVITLAKNKIERDQMQSHTETAIKVALALVNKPTLAVTK